MLPVYASSSTSATCRDLNDHLGHQAGDAAFQAVARALSVMFRKNDVPARIGGTQFLVFSLHLDAPTAAP